MKLTVREDGTVHVEGQAKIFTEDKYDDKDKDAQTWYITTRCGNKLILPAVVGTAHVSHGNGEFYLLQEIIEDPDYEWTDEEKQMVLESCPIATQIFMFDVEKLVYLYDFARHMWIPCRDLCCSGSLAMTFRGIYLNLLRELDRYDRECETLKCLRAIANTAAHFGGMEDLLRFASKINEGVKT